MPTDRNDLLDALLDALATRGKERTKAAGTTPNQTYLHGDGGLLSPFGLRAGIVNAIIMPLSGLAARLPVRLSTEQNTLRGILTGQTANTGSNPTTACGDAKQPGNLKLCTTTLPFGRLPFDSKVIQLDRLGETINRGEFVDHRLLGNPFTADAAEPAIAINPQTALKNEASKAIMEMTIGMIYEFGGLLYTAAPTNTPASTGYIEFNGLDVLINTGYQDAITKQACAAADSVVRSWNSVNVTTNPNGLVEEIIEFYEALENESIRTGLAPVVWEIAMRRGLFRELCNIWPCSYLTYSCTPTGTQNQQNFNASDAVTMRDGMLNGEYLLIRGKQIKVTIDDRIAETQPIGGTYESDIYFVPMTSPKFVESGGAITYWEYYDMRATQLTSEDVRMFAPDGHFQILGGGIYLVYKKSPSNVCLQFGMISKPRIILEAPFLAGRLTDIRYESSFHEREPLPSAPSNYEDGGRQNFTGYGPSYQTPTA